MEWAYLILKILLIQKGKEKENRSSKCSQQEGSGTKWKKNKARKYIISDKKEKKEQRFHTLELIFFQWSQFNKSKS